MRAPGGASGTLSREREVVPGECYVTVTVARMNGWNWQW
jgi:hypothetical protein